MSDIQPSIQRQLHELLGHLRLWGVPHECTVPADAAHACLIADQGRIVVLLGGLIYMVDGNVVSHAATVRAIQEAGVFYLTGEMMRRYALPDPPPRSKYYAKPCQCGYDATQDGPWPRDTCPRCGRAMAKLRNPPLFCSTPSRNDQGNEP